MGYRVRRTLHTLRNFLQSESFQAREENHLSVVGLEVFYSPLKAVESLLSTEGLALRQRDVRELDLQ
jgi:hypothetical protein